MLDDPRRRIEDLSFKQAQAQAQESGSLWKTEVLGKVSKYVQLFPATDSSSAHTTSSKTRNETNKVNSPFS